MEYHLYNLNSSDFESMVNIICQKILGTGVISFSEGKDGGRDGKFNGTAQNYPSEKQFWNGKFIIQAKHTTNPIASCSDKDFEGIIDNEIKKISKLKQLGEVDNYLLFTNRKYSGIKGEKINKKIIDETGIENTAIIGKETINKQYLAPNKEIVRQFNLHKIHIPFDFSDEELRKIILAFKNQIPKLETSIKTKSDSLKYDFSHIDKKEKNKKNKLSSDYYKENILGKSLMEFDKIETFLKDPINEELKDYYYDTANELNEIISLKRDEFEAFEELFIYIYQLITTGSHSLIGSKRHITTFLHYMYIECLIGKK